MPRTSSSGVFSKVVGNRLREARTSVGISQAELARRLVVSAPYIAAVESGRHNVTVGQLYLFASALGIAVDVVFVQPKAEYESLSLQADRPIREPSTGVVQDLS